MSANPNAIWTQLLTTTQSVIQGLNLVYGSAGTSLPTGQVYVFKFPNDQYRLPASNVAYPCVQLSPGKQENDDAAEQAFESTMVIYPVLVTLLFASNHQFSLNNDLLYWRQQIIAAFRSIPATLRTALATALHPNTTRVQVFDCRLEPAPWLHENVWQNQNLDADQFLLSYHAAIPRNR